MTNIKNTFQGSHDDEPESINDIPGIKNFIEDWINPSLDRANCSEAQKEKITDILNQNPKLMLEFETTILKDDLTAYPFSVVHQDGFIDYIQDRASGLEHIDCSPDNWNNIEGILERHPNQMDVVKSYMKIELENGKGYLNRFISESAERIRQKYVEPHLD